MRAVRNRSYATAVDLNNFEIDKRKLKFPMSAISDILSYICYTVIQFI